MAEAVVAVVADLHTSKVAEAVLGQLCPMVENGKLGGRVTQITPVGTMRVGGSDGAEACKLEARASG